MPDLNRVFLMGRLTADPDLRYTPTGAAVCEVRLAVNRRWTTKEGQEQEEVLFIAVTVWNKQAEAAAQYLVKGSLVHVEGHLKLETWEDKTTAEKRSKIGVVAERLTFLERSPKSVAEGVA